MADKLWTAIEARAAKTYPGNPQAETLAERDILADPAAYGLTAHDVSHAVAAATPKKVRRDPNQPRPQPAPKAAGAEPKTPGITARVYAWCLANPDATKKDAEAAHPDVNPSTVRVQFGKARKSMAAD